MAEGRRPAIAEYLTIPDAPSSAQPMQNFACRGRRQEAMRMGVVLDEILRRSLLGATLGSSAGAGLSALASACCSGTRIAVRA